MWQEDEKDDQYYTASCLCGYDSLFQVFELEINYEHKMLACFLSLLLYVEIRMGSIDIRMHADFSCTHAKAIHYPNSHVQMCEVFAC
jgi:hypothetical protein